ncbi:MAG: MarR family transcriptional regulator [Xylanivirga thermophila]|jgi:DNA-binding MarR family transcriptional regulator|uniref:MarR family winged helix-turn-helix transcriptional regulator n=1 Tax=Xylanivirga thermophila TaxID=2496273 RepID=UPI00101C8365|nr:MarR family transcriptional regulator [Xylanivirga thermophila]
MDMTADCFVQQIEQLFPLFYKQLSIALSDKMIGGITFSQLLVMREINRGVNTTSDIATRLSISPAASSKFIDQIEKMGYIERINSAKDRRIHMLRLTKAGFSVMNDNINVRIDILKEILSCLEQDEIHTLADILEKLIIELKKR